MSIASSHRSQVPTMISPAEAYGIVLDATAPLPSRRVPLLEALGRTIAETVRADRDHPPFRRAMMDGYAVRVGSAGQTVDVARRQAAGVAPSPDPVVAHECVEIMTGAVCPPGTEAVVQKEHVRFDGNRVVLPAEIVAGRHIAEPGSECREGEVVVAPGDVATPLAIAALASVGRREVDVVPAPRAAVLVTGEELVSGSRDLLNGQIRDANGPMLAALAIHLGLAPPSCRVLGDDPAAILAALESAGHCELVLISGGASVGAFDCVPGVLADWGAEILFRKVRQKPGKPLLVARRGSTLVFALPGNPLACHFCFCRYVQPAVLRLAGEDHAIGAEGQLAAPVRPDRGRTFFMPSKVEHDPSSPTGWSIRPLPGVSSADVFHSHQANAYVELPAGKDELPAGHLLTFSFMAWNNRRSCTTSWR